MASRGILPPEVAMLTETLTAVLEGLKPTDRKVLELCLQGYTVPQIGAAIGRTERQPSTLPWKSCANNSWPLGLTVAHAGHRLPARDRVPGRGSDCVEFAWRRASAAVAQMVPVQRWLR